VKERGILFSAPMVRALLVGAKTQTRRAIKLREFGPSSTKGYEWTFRDRRALWNDVSTELLMRKFCRYGLAGDRLWVRETHAQFAVGDRTGTAPQCVAYRATCDADDGFDYVNNGDEVMRIKVTKWTPAIHMPRWASRITLEVTDVRVERLQDISEDDAKAEGVLSLSEAEVAATNPGGKTWSRGPATARYELLWDAINGDGLWASNPWVWAISFKRVTP